MAILPIRMYPDPVLREAAPDVIAVDDSLKKLIADMKETMVAAAGAGLAAPQVGVQRRVFVYRASREDDEDEDESVPMRALINPQIVERSGEVVAEEGCLSIPGLAFLVSRAQRIVVHALDDSGSPTVLEAEEFEARVIQHEVDHLDGVLYIDRLGSEDRREALRVIRERALAGEPTPAPRKPASAI